MSDWWSAAPIVGDAPAAAPSMDPAHRDLAIRTIYGEAANEPDQGQAAVAAVIRNRVQAGRYGGDSIPGVVLAKNQFEPWGNTAARQRMMALAPDDPRYQKIGGIVDQVFGGQMEDPTGGATHFVAPQAQAALGRPMPSWAQGEGQAIGRHTFFAPEGRVQQANAPGGDWWSSAPIVGQEPQQPAPVQHNTEGLSDRVAREGMSELAPPPTTALNAGARGIATGVTGNFFDELAGLAAAGGRTDSATPLGLGNILRGGYNYLIGDQKAADAYNMATAGERAQTAKAEADQPGASLAGNIVGGIAVPLGRAAQGATLAQRAAQGARAGAIYGGVAGAGAGEDASSRIVGGAAGGGVGGVLGAAAPVAIEGVVRGARSVSAPIANAVRGIRDPEGEAARRVTLSIQRDIGADPAATSRLTPAEFAASYQSGGPANLMDIGGETTRALARSAANTSPEGRQILNQSINDRFEGQSGRVTGWLNDTFNFPNAHAQQQAIEHVARTVNKPAYDKVMGANPVVSVPQDILNRPVVAQAMKDAVSLAKNRGESLSGPTETKTILAGPGYHIADDITPQAKTSLRYWDYVKKAMDARIEGMKRSGGIDSLDSKQKADLGGLIDAKQALVSHLDSVAPGYKEARAGAARFFGAENALEAGQNFVTQNFQNDAVRQQIAKMSPLERRLFQDGFVSRYIETLNKVGDRRSILNQVASSPAAREKLDLALGSKRAKELESGLRTEGIMDLARKAVQGNSTTARQLTELGLAGGTYSLGTGFDVLNPNPSALMSAALVYGAARGRGAINENVSRRVAEMLVSNDPRRLLQGIRIVARNENMLSSLRRFDAALGKSGAQQLPGNVPALQAPVALRADQEQQ